MADVKQEDLDGLAARVARLEEFFTALETQLPLYINGSGDGRAYIVNLVKEIKKIRSGG